MIYIEVQYDPSASVVRLAATTGFGEDRYAVTVPAPDLAAARSAYVDFCAMYHSIPDVELVLPSGRHVPPREQAAS